MKTEIIFINHASIIIQYDDCKILCDPWYEGEVFNKGWKLIKENDEEKIELILNEITHIWLSHEHPDHFSVIFFKKYKEIIKKRKIQILYQYTKLKNVINYIKELGLEYLELKDNKFYQIKNKTKIKIIKEGFYDSCLLVQNDSEKILNINDCEFKTSYKIKKLFKKVGKIDALLTQFSYAAWKGGVKNIAWRNSAALEKIEAMKLIHNIMLPRYIIPFASFIYFSNEKNKYMNDLVNSPRKIIQHLNCIKENIYFLKHHDKLSENIDNEKQEEVIEYWERLYSKINILEYSQFNKVEFDKLRESYLKYTNRINNYNNMKLLKIISRIPVLNLFNPINIYLDDHDMVVQIDIFNKELSITNSEADVSIASESLNFILNNIFGFYTLKVNACFEELKQGGFLKLVKIIAIENLNNIGIKVDIGILFEINIINIFFNRIRKVRRSLIL